MLKIEEQVKLRAENEQEAQAIINDYREKYNVKKATFERKEKKSKGEVIGEAYLVVITTVHADFWTMED
jgi:hypothetical protein